MLYADLIFTGGNLLTLDAQTPKATAMAVREGKIVAVGEDALVEQYVGEATRRVHLAGKTLLPGFCDAHLHLYMYGGLLLRETDLVGVQSIPDLLARLEAHDYDGPWLLGRGFDQDILTEGCFPTRTDLDKISRTRPIRITRICGHAIVVNSHWHLSAPKRGRRATRKPDSTLRRR
jgi:predicted amidohydrolase YtcJ